MAEGILRRGFQIHLLKPQATINIRKNTKTQMQRRGGSPIVTFSDTDVILFQINGRWHANIAGEITPIYFPKGGVPYPLSYFEKKSLGEP